MHSRFLIALVFLLSWLDVFSQPGTNDMLPTNIELTDRLRGHKFHGKKSTARAWYGNDDKYFPVGPDDIIKVDRVIRDRGPHGGGDVDYVEFQIMNNKKLEDIDKKYGVAAYVLLDELVDAENPEENDVFKQVARENARAQQKKMLYVSVLLLGCVLVIWLIVFLRNLVLSRVREQLKNAGLINGLKLLSVYPCEFRTRNDTISHYTGTVRPGFTGGTVNVTPRYDTYATVQHGWVLKARNVGKSVIQSARLNAALHDGRGMKEEINSMGVSNIRPGESKYFVYKSSEGLFAQSLFIRGVSVLGDGHAGTKDLDIRVPYFRLPAWPIALLMGILLFRQIDFDEWQSLYSLFVFATSLLAFICAGVGAMKNRTMVLLMVLTMILTLLTPAPYLVLVGAAYIGLVVIKRLDFADVLSATQTKGI